MLGNLEVEQGRVLYFAGENYVDIQMRWIAMAQQMDFDVKTIPVHFRRGRFKLSKKMDQLRVEVDQLGGVDFIIVDGSSAFFEGDDEKLQRSGRRARHPPARTDNTQRRAPACWYYATRPKTPATTICNHAAPAP